MKAIVTCPNFVKLVNAKIPTSPCCKGPLETCLNGTQNRASNTLAVGVPENLPRPTFLTASVPLATSQV